MKRLLTILVLLLPVSALADVQGTATVVDGDTIEIHSQRIRLHGIDAPEWAQLCFIGGKRWSCGRDAANILFDLIAQRPVRCVERDRDRYRRIVDLGAWMVSTGLAVAYRKFSMDYDSQERLAKKAKAGIWGSEFILPWKWRRGVRWSSGGPA